MLAGRQREEKERRLVGNEIHALRYDFQDWNRRLIRLEAASGRDQVCRFERYNCRSHYRVSENRRTADGDSRVSAARR